MNAKGQLLDFDYQRFGHLFNEYSQETQSVKKREDETAAMVDRLIANSRRQQELVAGSQ